MAIQFSCEFYIILLLLVVVLLIVFGWMPSIVSKIGGGMRLKDLKKHPRSKSEKYVIDIFEKITSKKFPTAYPSWLKWKGRPMELDGYNEKLKIAVEFSGPQHTKHYPEKESYEEYWNRVQKDREKIRLCNEHKVKLIVIDMSIPQHLLYPYIMSRLYDIGFIKDKPATYMTESLATPYENPTMQQELIPKKYEL